MSGNIVYIDEAGNTGSRLIDDQPFLTMVCIGLPMNNLANVTAFLDDLKKKEKIQILHAKNLRGWRRPRIAKELLEMLMEKQMNFFIGINEKKYVIATFIEDDFFDPVFNSNCDNSWTHPDGKRDRADLIFQHLSDEAFKECAYFFHKGERADEALVLVQNCLAGTYLQEHLKGLRINELEEIIKDQNCNSTNYTEKKGVLKSPNFFSMLGLLSKIEYHYREGINEDVEVIFDSSPQFDNSFITFFSLLKNATPTYVYNSNLSIPNVYGYTHLNRFRCLKSSDEPMLQITDVIVTSINDLVRKIAREKELQELEDSERFLLWFIYQQWHKFDNRFCDYVVSTEVLKKIWDTLVKNAPSV